MRQSQIKSAKKIVGEQGESVISMFLDHKSKLRLRSRIAFAFQVITAQFIVDESDFKQQKIFKKIRGRMGRKKMEERQEIQNRQQEYERQILQALGAAAEAKIIITHIGKTIEPDGYDMQGLIEDALQLAEAEAKKHEEMELENEKSQK